MPSNIPELLFNGFGKAILPLLKRSHTSNNLANAPPDKDVLGDVENERSPSTLKRASVLLTVNIYSECSGGDLERRSPEQLKQVKQLVDHLFSLGQTFISREPDSGNALFQEDAIAHCRLPVKLMEVGGR